MDKLFPNLFPPSQLKPTKKNPSLQPVLISTLSQKTNKEAMELIFVDGKEKLPETPFKLVWLLNLQPNQTKQQDI